MPIGGARLCALAASRYASRWVLWGSTTLLRAWSDAPAFLLSCPGPLRRHHAALHPISQLTLPQCLLGGEAQLHAFAAGATELRSRMFFAPLPEMFASRIFAAAPAVAFNPTLLPSADEVWASIEAMSRTSPRFAGNDAHRKFVDMLESTHE